MPYYSLHWVSSLLSLSPSLFYRSFSSIKMRFAGRATLSTADFYRKPISAIALLSTLRLFIVLWNSDSPPFLSISLVDFHLSKTPFPPDSRLRDCFGQIRVSLFLCIEQCNFISTSSKIKWNGCQLWNDIFISCFFFGKFGSDS